MKLIRFIHAHADAIEQQARTGLTALVMGLWLAVLVGTCAMAWQHGLTLNPMPMLMEMFGG